MTCGSVDDGKSTLLGRLLYDAGAIPSDQMVANDDYASLLDGLIAEQEQKITIDVAYRYFETKMRKYIIADTPGHDIYIRNMATAASTAGVAIILIDVTKGVVSQTKRHLNILSLMRVEHVVVAVNKMDLVDYDADKFKAISDAFLNSAQNMEFQSVKVIPVAAKGGGNIVTSSPHMPWYQGKTLLSHLDDLDACHASHQGALRFPIQMVRRDEKTDACFYGGTVASGVLFIGDEILDVKTGEIAHVKTILSPDGDVPKAITGDAIEITLDREMHISRGHILSHRDNACRCRRQQNVSDIGLLEEYIGLHRSVAANQQCQDRQKDQRYPPGIRARDQRAKHLQQRAGLCLAGLLGIAGAQKA